MKRLINILQPIKAFFIRIVVRSSDVPKCKYCENKCMIDHEKIYEFNIFGLRILIFNPYKYEYLDVCETCWVEINQSKNDKIYEQIYNDGFNDGVSKCSY